MSVVSTLVKYSFTFLLIKVAKGTSVHARCSHLGGHDSARVKWLCNSLGALVK